MTKFKKPQKTELQSVPINASLAALILQGKAPPTCKAFRYGVAEILAIPPVNDVGWYLNIARNDRMPTTQEIQIITGLIIPITGIPVQVFSSKEKESDGRFHVEVVEAVPEPIRTSIETEDQPQSGQEEGGGLRLLPNTEVRP